VGSAFSAAAPAAGAAAAGNSPSTLAAISAAKAAGSTASCPKAVSGCCDLGVLGALGLEDDWASIVVSPADGGEGGWGDVGTSSLAFWWVLV
jgi:hypothetical protein